jgi:myo-inositol 2-dehydrogenase/D-chiro-inositol 1-dehydrogenase
MSKPAPSTTSNSRRQFLKSTAAVAGMSLASLPLGRSAHAAGSDVIRVGLIGCGGRGSGAAANAMNAGADIQLVAMGDLFADNAQKARDALRAAKPEQVQVDEDHVFDGFDAYQKVLECDIDVVLIAAASRFHPQFLQAAIAADKHVFIEKPHSVEVPGLSIVGAACEEAKRKGLAVVSGLCWRYDEDVRETVKRVQDGAIGEIVAIESTYLRTPYRLTQRNPEWTELEWQLRNWYHFCWLSGDDVLQSLIHNLDKAAWLLEEETPIAAFGLGGRSSVVEPYHGDQFDNASIAYEYASGVRLYGFNRAQDGCFRQTADRILGTKGEAHMPSRCKLVVGGETIWQPDRKKAKASMYDNEQRELFESIRAGKPLNNSAYMVSSTMLAILGRMVAYTGKRLTWDEALKSEDLLGPRELTWETEPPVHPGPDGLYAAPIPGFAEFS